jgi:hypothetical protein
LEGGRAAFHTPPEEEPMETEKPGVTTPEIPATPRPGPEADPPRRAEPEVPEVPQHGRPELPHPGGDDADATPPQPDRISPPVDPATRERT